MNAEFQAEIVQSEEAWFTAMLGLNESYDELVKLSVAKSMGYLKDYEMFGFDEFLKKSEDWAEFAKTIKKDKFSIKEIREQRERVQWQKKMLRDEQDKF